MMWGAWIVGGFFLVMGVGGVVLVMMSGQLAAAREALEAANARATGFEEAARWRAKDNLRASEAAAVDETLRAGNGADAPLSDYLRDGAGRVWP